MKDRIPPGAVLVFEVELRKLKLGKEREAEVATEMLVFSLTLVHNSHPLLLFPSLSLSVYVCVCNNSRLEPPPPSPPTSRERGGSVKEMTQSFEDHLTAPSEETEENQRSKLLSKMSRLGGQAILPPGTMPTHHVSQGVWSQWAWSLWV